MLFGRGLELMVYIQSAKEYLVDFASTVALQQWKLSPISSISLSTRMQRLYLTAAVWQGANFMSRKICIIYVVMEDRLYFPLNDLM